MLGEHVDEFLIGKVAVLVLGVLLLVEVQVEVLLVEGAFPAPHHVQWHPAEALRSI